MKQPTIYITALSCFLLVSVLPGRSSTHAVEDISKASELREIPKTTAPEKFSEVHDMKEPLLPTEGTKPLSVERRPEDEIFIRGEDPLHPSKDNFFKKIKKYFAFPNFLKKVFAWLWKGSIQVPRAKGKTASIPYWAFWIHHKEDWGEMDKDIVLMISALQKLADREFLRQTLTHNSKIYSHISPALEDVPKPFNYEKYIIEAKTELEFLNGELPRVEDTEKERQMLLVKSLVVLSRNPKYHKDAVDAIETVLATMHRKDPAKLPKVMPYFEAAHYVMTIKGHDYSARLLKAEEEGPDIEEHFKSLDWESWVEMFRKQKNDKVRAAYQKLTVGEAAPDQSPVTEAAPGQAPVTEATTGQSPVIEATRPESPVDKAERPESPVGKAAEVPVAEAEHPEVPVTATLPVSEAARTEAINDIIKWSAGVLDPKQSHKYESIDLLFALSTLYYHSLHKPPGIGSQNPAFQALIRARKAWRTFETDDDTVRTGIEVTAKLAAKHSAPIRTEELPK
ncbi:hypothetical protein PTTG_05435 [Puccinia triticina 1-1 BBBD Race 1]|uniref:Uncharacterized protein n=1 Tax=Puccinia triticina (isolate 1-1 / race 1 (BBBD)) TaxID=630390 RepID=A0A180GRJ6_PUCT1|nr:hypothetical protein PTTG_05435 [Puccinia triticina 1-1 BBBD Race 1]